MGGRLPASLLSTQRSWVVAAVVLAIATIGQTKMSTNSGSEDLIYALAMVVPASFVNRMPRRRRRSPCSARSSPCGATVIYHRSPQS
jgi:hypothetical protein